MVLSLNDARELTRPALRYFGGKWNLAPWIIQHFPVHTSYVDAFGGGAGVLLQKPRSGVETYNDLNGEVVNFFRVLRDQPDELLGKLCLTPYAREEYATSHEPTEDDIERARRLFVRLWMSIGGMNQKKPSSWRYVKSVRGGSKAPAGYWTLDHLYMVAERLMGVQIENRDAFYVIPHYDSATTLTYLDPPYVPSTRTSNHRYSFELTTEQHEQLAMIAHDLEGFCIISGYPSELYADLYELHGWKRIETKTRINNSRTAREAAAYRTEALWLSPRVTAEAPAPGLFDMHLCAEAVAINEITEKTLKNEQEGLWG